MKGQVRIEEMFAFIVMDTDNTEGIVAYEVGGMMFPLVGADMKRVDSLRPIAGQIARELGKEVTLVKFTNRVEVEEIL